MLVLLVSYFHISWDHFHMWQFYNHAINQIISLIHWYEMMHHIHQGIKLSIRGLPNKSFRGSFYWGRKLYSKLNNTVQIRTTELRVAQCTFTISAIKFDMLNGQFRMCVFQTHYHCCLFDLVLEVVHQSLVLVAMNLTYLLLLKNKKNNARLMRGGISSKGD